MAPLLRCPTGRSLTFLIVHIPWHCFNYASTRSTLTRASVVLGEVTVHVLSHSIKGTTRWAIPSACTIVAIRFHTLAGDRNGDASNGWTRGNGVKDTKGIWTLSGLGMSLRRNGITGGRRENTSSRSPSFVTARLYSSRQYVTITMVAGSCLSRTSHTKERTFPSSGVSHMKDGVTYWVSHSTMISVSGVSRHIRTGGRSKRSKVNSLFRC